MFYQTALKWLIITVTVLIGLLAILLFLGYLLKDNEVKTTKLIAQLEQEAIQQERKLRNESKPYLLKNTISTFEKSQQDIIANNLVCQSSKQCFVVQTHSKNIGCLVAINTVGAAILLKASSQNKSNLSSDTNCQKLYQTMPETLVHCKSNICSL